MKIYKIYLVSETEHFVISKKVFETFLYPVAVIVYKIFQFIARIDNDGVYVECRTLRT